MLSLLISVLHVGMGSWAAVSAAADPAVAALLADIKSADCHKIPGGDGAPQDHAGGHCPECRLTLKAALPLPGIVEAPPTRARASFNPQRTAAEFEPRRFLRPPTRGPPSPV